jgi:hypothetical protein
VETPELDQLEGATLMYSLHATTALEMEIQSFAATLNHCFRDARWDVVSYYAENAWLVSERTDARWSEVESRVHTAWELGNAPRSLRAHRVLANDVASL